MSAALRWAGLAGVGAGLMYILDPDKGRRRRAVLRDKGASFLGATMWGAGKAWRDLAHRTEGVTARTRSLWPGRKAQPDEHVIEARVRSRLGRVTSHPGAIDVAVTGRRVRLEGPVLESEHAQIISAVRSVTGVDDVEDRLERHTTAEGISSLQGGVARPGQRMELMQENWTPAVRAIAGGAGLGMLAWAVRSRSVPAMAAGFAGAAMLGRAITNKKITRVIGFGAGRRTVDVQKTISVAAPIGDVYRFWSNYRNFPSFMRHIREVEDLGGGRSRWVAYGPGGMSVSWDAEMTERIENRIMAWKSAPGSMIENAGVIRFDEAPDGNTRVTIRLSYNPLSGAIGHAVASLFGADPKREIGEDLQRMKSLIEEGAARAGGRAVDRGGTQADRPFVG